MPGPAGSEAAREGTKPHAGASGTPAVSANGRVRYGLECHLQEETMRIPMIVATAVLLTVGAGAAPAASTMDMPYLAVASAVQQTPPAQPSGGDVKVDVDLDDDGGVWYTDPLWIVLGAAAVIVVIALVAAAARGGGGTTVIR